MPLVGLVTAALLVGSLSAPASAADEPQPTTPTPTPASVETPEDPTAAAEQALADVQAILDPTESTSSSEPATTAAEPQDLTLALRDLRLRMQDLSPKDRALAQTLIDRPGTDADPFTDFGHVRVHWKAADTAITPEWVATVGAVVNHVLTSYQKAGYRRPESDGTVGGGADLFDIYLVDFANDPRYGPGLYGFCDASTTPPAEGPYDVAGFCAFDHTFSSFPNRPPLENLEVTAAHELFHAVQFAYDYSEDSWFMEATATWAEDEVYDGINDNRQYLRLSPMRQPRQSLDQHGAALRQYGEWIFFRYLTERFPASQAGLPVIMRRLWKRVDGSLGAPDDYSIHAVDRELRARGTDLRRFYARFADANRHPSRAYEEGSAYRPAPTGAFAFRRGFHDTGWRAPRLDHLSAHTLKFTPSASMRRWRLHLAVNLPDRALGTAAVLTTYDRDGRPTRRSLRISKRGDGAAVVGFGTSRIARAELTLVNAGIRYRCWTGAVDGVEYSCRGRSRDDGRPMRYRVWATR